MGTQRKESEMFELIRHWEESDEDRATFCKANNLTISTFSYWRTKYRKSQATSSNGFIELKPTSPSALEIVYPNGVVIRMPPTTTLSALKALIRMG
jgi:hypothetical protein